MAPGSGSDVLLIAMPWDRLYLPSLQLGILQSVLAREGIPADVRLLGLRFMEHCLRATAHRPEEERIRLRDYALIADSFSLADWVFAVPPFRDPQESDEGYLSFLRTCCMPASDIRKAHIMRALVPAFLDRAAAEILAAAPRVVGFTCTSSRAVASLVLAKVLKARRPALTIVFGGASCDGPMGAALHRAFPWIDIVVRGEGERVLPALLRDLLAERPVRPQPGLCYREGRRSVAIDQAGAAPVDMDDIPTPTYDAYFAQLAQTSFGPQLLAEVELPYESARGCWWGAKSHCTFCGLNGSAIAFRSKSPDRVVAEVTALARRYRRLDFFLVDNVLDLRYLREVLPRLHRLGLSLFCDARATLTREQVHRLRAGGVQRFQPGIESLSAPVLRLMRKGVTAFQNVRLLKWCACEGVRVNWNLLYGLPGEPPEAYARMAEDIPSLTHLDPPNLVPLLVERFSVYHERPGEFGLELLGPAPWYRLIYPVEPATLADLAFLFEYRHLDGREPEQYVEPVRRAVAGWRANRAAGYRSLRCRRGPGFLVVQDRRPGLEAADYTFEGRGAEIYLACEDGATPGEVSEALRSAGIRDRKPDAVRRYLDELVAMRLVYREGDRYLALALPEALPEAASYAAA